MVTSSRVPRLPESLLAKLACPECRRELRLAGRDGEGAAPAGAAAGSLICAGCARGFPIRDGVPLLFPTDGPADWTAAQTALYDGIAPHYDTSIPSHVAAHYRAKRVALVHRLAPPRAAVLDVGCGTGTLTEALGREGFDVYGLDASTGMLAQLGVAGRGQPVGGFGERLPFASEVFDLSITVATLHHITDSGRIAATIAEMCRVTRPGGHVVVWDHNPKNPYWPLLMRRVPQDTGEERLVPQEEIVADFRAAGVGDLQAHRSGLVPDFTPPILLGLARVVEALVEVTPGLNVFCAHNVVVGRKGVTSAAPAGGPGQHAPAGGAGPGRSGDV